MKKEFIKEALKTNRNRAKSYGHLAKTLEEFKNSDAKTLKLTFVTNDELHAQHYNYVDLSSARNSYRESARNLGMYPGVKFTTEWPNILYITKEEI